MATHYIKRQGGGCWLARGVWYPKWLQVSRIDDQRVETVHYAPAALGGWTAGRVEVQGSNDWPKMTADTILAFKRDSDELVEIITDAQVIGQFEAAAA